MSIKKSGTNQACARCKYQRRKCTSECVLAQYFPPEQPKVFQNAHKLFGVGNILKILKDLDQTQKMEAMKSIIYEANIRDKFPVHGCAGVILQYQYHIQQVEEELKLVRSQLALAEQRSAQNNLSQLHLGLPMTSTPENALDLFETPIHINPVICPTVSDPLNCYSGNDNVVNSLWNRSNDNNNNHLVLHNQLQALNIQHDVVDQDYEFCEAIDDRQSYVDSKEVSD